MTWKSTIPVAWVVLSFGAAAPAVAKDEPSAPPEATRIHKRSIDLDGDRRLERVFVYDMDAKDGLPSTYFAIWDESKGRKGRGWKLGQVTKMWGPGPSTHSGLRGVWIGDLNGDGLVEVAARDLVSPSVGELLTIYRQGRRGALRFSRLQIVSGDQVRVLPMHGGNPRALEVVTEAGRSVDGQRHDERWTWNNGRDKWICESDCAGSGG